MRLLCIPCGKFCSLSEKVYANVLHATLDAIQKKLRSLEMLLKACKPASLGIDLKPGDEVLTTTHDYGRMITTFKQRERREGIKLVQFSSTGSLQKTQMKLFGFLRRTLPRETRMILMCHIVNITGQIMPVKKVVQMARDQKEFQSLWMELMRMPISILRTRTWIVTFMAPACTSGCLLHMARGYLYVRKEKIGDLWPLMASPEAMDDNIRKV